MKRIMELVVCATFLCAPVFAEEPDKGQKPADQEAKEEQVEHKVDASSPTTQTPLPPGLEKRGKLPPGLEKKGKTPHGWSQGKAWWKHPGQTPQGLHPTGNGGVFSGGHAGHSTPGHGHR